MNEPDGKPTLIDVFARVDKYVAIAAGIASAVTFARGNRFISDVYPQTPSQSAITPTPTAIPDMAFVPAGNFPMGDDSDLSLPDAQPQRSVFLDAYWIDLSEVTNQQYQRFVEDGNHPPPEHWSEKKFPAGKENHPVVNVTWHDAEDYCRFVGKRLPTEAEWEKAARGSEGLIWPWGNQWGSGPANTAERNAQDTAPVGSFSEGNSPHGLADMAGNIWEWVNDWYEADYYSVAPRETQLAPNWPESVRPKW